MNNSVIGLGIAKQIFHLVQLNKVGFIKADKFNGDATRFLKGLNL